ncbi:MULTISPECIES: photosystem II reaction center protein Psb28 [Prochlorococcus]|uniref:photosystem II reaction center protein Psb28 n=1 Tax=Prochlorococcus TaxID=1218 RepID=UPI0005339255|nr:MULTISPECIES: photosystem II reaction center protein Psb28 [Prochlorococcus]KGG12619.1 Photosystem II 13 kDa protein Psb28 (PsbW) [Prochlorococcus sp. MIT 0601]
MSQSKINPVIQFYKGVNEEVVPEIRLTRSKDGKTGQAIFIFEKPKALSEESVGDITGMTMLDEEGELKTREIKARFLNGEPNAIESTYTWKTEADFQRFMRFAKRYAENNGLGYSEK